MPPPPAFPPGLDIAVLSILAHLLHWGLFGTLTIQIYLYYQAFPNDRRFTKCLVYTVYVIELVQTMIMACDAFAIFGYGFGDLAALTGIVSFIGQTFYAYRLYVLSKRRQIPLGIVLISLASTVAAILTGIFSFEAENVFHLQSRVNSEISAVWFGGSALVDMIIAASLMYYLLKRDQGFRQTHALVVKMVRLIIETGSLTALVALANLSVFLAFPQKPYFVTGTAVLPTLYANTILVLLNARIQIVGGRGYAPATDMIMSPGIAFQSSGGTVTGISVSSPAVTLNRETFAAGETGDVVEMKSVLV
ncbi:hypothetical protein B0H13DRAFT_2001877 [Mycena leptocephala]|nr:hypothetical protein B0H13DRAFT_2001877 [Mycena leptocephala]